MDELEQIDQVDGLQITRYMWNYTSSLNRNQKSNYTCRFDDKYYGHTIINEWELVCDKQYSAALSQSFYLCGFISSFVSGILSDKYGRKRITSFIGGSILNVFIGQYIKYIGVRF